MPAPDDPVERWLYGGALVGLIGGAWAALGFLGASAYAPYLSHSSSAGDAPWPVPTRLLVFVAGWTLMSIAMMLPSSLPLVTVFHTIARRTSLVALLVAGYLAIWAVFGVAAFLADGWLHALLGAVLDASPGLQARPDLIPAMLLVATGLFQFSPLKQACLTQCRSPVGFVVQHWRGGSQTFRAFILGLRHGMFCIGCCWALMLLMFAVGGVHLGWMLLLAAVMFVEKTVSWGRWITDPVGAILALWGIALLVRIPGVPPPF